MISVIINCFNEEDYIACAVNSVLNQTRIDLIEEIFVVDDGSTDQSLLLINDIKTKDPRIKVLTQVNSGLPSARNFGIRNCKEEWVAFLDGDDIWMPDKIEKQVKLIESIDDVDLVYTDSIVLKSSKSRVSYSLSLPTDKKKAFIKYYLYDAPIVPSSVIVRRSVLLENNCFDEQLLRCQDTYLWSKILIKYTAVHIKEPLFIRRVHDRSLSANIESKANYKFIVAKKLRDEFEIPGPVYKKKIAAIYLSLSRKYLKNKKYNLFIESIKNAVISSPMFFIHYSFRLLSRRGCNYARRRFKSEYMI